MNSENKYYYPSEYKKLSDDPTILKTKFKDFVNNHRDSHTSYALTQIIASNSSTNGIGAGLGFIIDTYKNKLIIATCNHVINPTALSANIVIKDVYIANKFVGSQEFDIENIFKAKKEDKDLAFIVCKKPLRFLSHKAKINHDLHIGLIGGYYKNTQNDYAFSTGYLGDITRNLTHVEMNEKFIYSRPVHSFQLDPRKQVYINIDMISRSGMSGGPIISEGGIAGMMVGGKLKGSTMIPATSILSHYEKNVKPLIK